VWCGSLNRKHHTQRVKNQKLKEESSKKTLILVIAKWNFEEEQRKICALSATEIVWSFS